MPGRLAGAALVLALAVWASLPLNGQGAGPGIPAADALRRYLDDYEPRVSELIAEERFEQRLARGSAGPSRRRLVSEVAFLRLPGNLEWLGTRRVLRMNGRRLDGDAQTLDTMLVAAGPDRVARAQAIADANAYHNLGHPRSINLPTLPLDLPSARNAGAFEVSAGPPARIAGRDAQRVTFEERLPARLVSHGDGRFVRAMVRAWVATDSGALIRAEVDLVAPIPLRLTNHSIVVEFADDRALGILVPTTLTERAPGLVGYASYRRYRRFSTGARVIP